MSWDGKTWPPAMNPSDPDAPKLTDVLTRMWERINELETKLESHEHFVDFGDGEPGTWSGPPKEPF